ncbi:sigma-70 family RNA polymerase sigma factor [Phycisphaerales bacterium AB-hyl4]|uniref:Sigma-70 family RNA polymerase sigma factor n=1 Tax=Natronomicrosphaera hydrolytica TaxID=3242702 RepID=A0ABV4U8Y5_9BACT
MNGSDKQRNAGTLAITGGPTGKSSVDGDGELSDRELMRRVVDRDRTALAELYDRYSHYVQAACLRVLANMTDAEDVTVQVFIEVWERPGRFEASRGEFVTYLMILARSRATDLRRSQTRRRQLMRNAADELIMPMVDTTTPAESASWRERRGRVRRALSRLGELQREAVELAFLEGLSHREVAERLNTPLGTIKTRIRLGLIQLRDSLRTMGEGDEP